MSDTFIERSICEAIDIIAERKIAEAGFDKTKKVVIDTLIDKATGEYRVKDQDSYYTAYATSSEIFFTKGQEVYVLIPGNDMQRRKTILGGNSVVATNYQDIPPASESYNSVGSNFITEQLNSFGQIPLCSYKNDIFILYDKDNMTGVPFKDEETGQSINFLDETLVDKYIKQGDGLALSFTVRTALDSLQQGGGSYGMIVEAVVNDDNGNAAVQRYNVSNLDVIGQPFRLISPTKVEHFEHNIDTSKVQYIQKIYLYTYGFPGQEEDKPNDIFFKNIFIGSGLTLTKQQLDGYIVHIDYSKNGNQLGGEKNLEKVILQAQLKVKGRIITKDVQYYWFRKDNTVSRGSSKYSDKGGQGWECLNYKESVGSKEFVPYTKNTFTFTSVGEDNSKQGVATTLEKNTQILCVARYNGTNFSEKGNIINYNVKEVFLTSSDKKGDTDKTDYYFGMGSPVLTCRIFTEEGEEFKESDYNNYKFTWSVAPARGRAQKKDETTELNTNYRDRYLDFYGTNTTNIISLPSGVEKVTDSKIGYYTQRNKIAKGSLSKYDATKVGSKTKKKLYDDAQSEWKKIQFAERINGRYYIYFPISSITNYSTISCTVYDNDEKYVGTGSITLYNKLEVQGMYSLNLNNATEVFQYDGKGNSPVSPQIKKPLQIKPLTFTLLDNNGAQISTQAIINNGSITWLFPKTNTLLKCLQTDPLNEIGLTGIDKALAADFYLYRNTETNNRESFSYSIVDQYDAKKTNNYIRLIIKYRNLIFDAYTNFTFPKDGDPGTNGTDFVGKIVPLDDSEKVLATERIYISDQNRDAKADRQYIFDDNGNEVKKLSFQLYNNSIKVNTTDADFWTCPPGVDGVNKRFQKNKEVPTYLQKNGNSWNVFQLKQKVQMTVGTQIQDIYLKYTGKNTLDRIVQAAPINIIRAQYGTGGNQNDLKYYAEYPVCTQFCVTNYRIKVKPKTGFQYVIYDQDGTNPKYDNSLPFEIIVEKLVNSYWQIDDSHINKNWNWRIIGNLQQDENKNINLQNNQKYFKPKDNFSGEDLSSAIAVGIPGVGRIHIPVYMIINRYGHAAINSWDGNSIDLGNETGTILAPQVGAGSKTNNQFTGVLMGQIKTGDKQQVGLFGYHNGQRSIFLDSKTGKAQFGKNNAAKIILDPAKKMNNKDTAFIYSNNFLVDDIKDSSGEVIKKGYITNKGSLEDTEGYINYQKVSDQGGLMIDMTTPQIVFANGKFNVSGAGKLHSQSGDIAGWIISDTKLFKDILPYKKTDGTIQKGSSTGMASKGNPVFWAYETLLDEDGKTVVEDRNFYVKRNGFLFSKSGQIGGWNISENSLWNTKKDENNNNIFTVGMNVDPAKDDGKVFYAGKNKNVFYVTHDGYLRSISGKIAEWNIQTNYLTDNNVGMGRFVFPNTSTNKNPFGESITARFWGASSQVIKKDGTVVGDLSNLNFAVSSNGELFSKKGRIGGWHIQQGQLWAISNKNEAKSKIVIGSDGTIYGGNPSNQPSWSSKSVKPYSPAQGQDDPDDISKYDTLSGGGSWMINADGSSSFKNITVDYMKATNVDVTGDVTATNLYASNSGYIGGFKIGSNTLSGGSLTLYNTGAMQGSGWDISSRGTAHFGSIYGTIAANQSLNTGSGSITNGNGTTVNSTGVTSGGLSAPSSGTTSVEADDGTVMKGLTGKLFSNATLLVYTNGFQVPTGTTSKTICTGGSVSITSTSSATFTPTTQSITVPSAYVHFDKIAVTWGSKTTVKTVKFMVSESVDQKGGES